MNTAVRAIGLTSVTMIAFAANSLLCRLALGHAQMDPVSFTLVRVASAAVTLTIIATARKESTFKDGSWISAGWLVLYAGGFALAYTELTTGTGALILFGGVQATMILAGVWEGERPGIRVWLGLVVALLALVALLLPGIEAPAPLPAASMIAAGIGWGLYSLRGRGVARPVAVTSGNFVRASVLVAVGLPFVSASSLSGVGLYAAITSGALASGTGYVLWYAALKYLSATRAAIVQLTVPVIAAVAGIVILAEDPSLRLALAGAGVLGVLAATAHGARDARPLPLRL